MELVDNTSIDIRSNADNTMVKVNRQSNIKPKQHTTFEWIHLIATICVPIITAIYIIIDNNN